MLSSALVFSTVAASTLVTSFISGILGMAGGMMLLGVLLALMPLPEAMVVHGIAQLAANGWRALGLRREVDWRVIRGYALGACAVGLLLWGVRFTVEKPVALIAMGLLPFAALALPQNLHLNVERPLHPLACGAACLALSLTAGIAGPILDVFFVRSRMSRLAVVATKAVTQSLSHLTKIAFFGALAAASSPAIAPEALAGVVILAFAGTALSRQVLERMSDASFRRWTRGTVMALGCLYLVAGVRLLIAG